MTDDFCNLHQHTTESHLDAICDIDALFDRAKELNQKALAVTDHGTMGGIYRAYKASKRTGVKLIPGNEIYFVTNIQAESKKDEGWHRYHLVLLAMNAKGYENLLRITYEGSRESVYVRPPVNKMFPRIDASILRKYNEGLIALSACGGNIIARTLLSDEHEEAVNYARLLKDIFGDRFYMELQPHDMTYLSKVGDDKVAVFNQRKLNDELKKIAAQIDVQTVATCDAHYIKKEDEKYHDMVLAICDKEPLESMERHRYTSKVPCPTCKGETLLTKKKCENFKCVKGIIDQKLCQEFYLKTGDEIRSFFVDSYGEEYADQLVKTSGLIADKCEWPDFIEPSGKEHIPKFDMKHISQSPDTEQFVQWRSKNPNMLKEEVDIAYMKFSCLKGFHIYCKRRKFDKETKDKYWKRMCFEIDIYATRGFASYMLIVADYIRWARDQGILIGPGRGSVGGSLAAFFLGIHKVDPIQYGLLFERFVNLYKKSLPDVDTDFAPSGRDLVFEYVRKKYGEEKVAYISNLNRFTPKVVLTDVVRSLTIGGDKSEAFRIAKEATACIPSKAEDANGRIVEIDDMAKAQLYSSGEAFDNLIDSYPEVLEYCESIVGLPRNYSTHAAGVVISDVPLPSFVPIRRDKKGSFSVQYDKNQVEEMGLVKMDFLGLTTLDIMSETIEQAKNLGMTLPTPDDLVEATDDVHAFEVIQKGLTTGCFQIEGATLKPLCKPMAPKTIEDIAFINALGRPGCSKAERKEFLSRRDGKSAPVPPHPLLRDILSHTYGISIYEEDLLHLAQHIAGWDLSEADGLRKVTKLKEKGAALADKLEKKFIKDCMDRRDLSVQDATFIWDKVVIPYSKYGFNKAHAVAYSILGYQTSYYKYYARGPFFSAVLNSKLRGGKTPDSAEKINNVKKDAKQFGVSIDVCDVNRSKQYYVAVEPKRVVTGLGAIKGLGDTILDQIIARQPYASFEDFVRKNLKKVNKNHAAALAKAGAFDTLKVTRKFVHDHFPTFKEEYKKHIKKLDDDMFELGDRNFPLPETMEGFTYSEINDETEEWNLQERLAFEKEVLGEYVSGSAKDMFPGFFQGSVYDCSIEEIKAKKDKSKVGMEGVITGVREIIIKKSGKNQGRTMAKLTVENLRGESINVTVWPDDYDRHKNVFKQGDTPIRGVFIVNEWAGEKSLVMTQKVKLFERN